MTTSTRGCLPRQVDLTLRDLEILRWIGRHGIVTSDQVAHKYFLGKRAAYRRIRALVSLRLVTRNHTFWKEPTALRVTTAGARLANLTVAPAALVLPDVRHSVALVTLSECLLSGHPRAVYVTERELRAAELRARRQDPSHPRYQRIPDGLLLLPDGQRVAIELDLTAKRTREIERIIAAYQNMYLIDADHGITSVRWFAPPGEARRLRTAVEEACCTDLITVEDWRP